MALTPSTMMPLGTAAPDFELQDVISGQTFTPTNSKGENGLMIMFICAHCPYVKHLEKEVAQVAKEYQQAGIGFVAISSNDIANYPEDDPDGLRDQATRNDFSFPYLFDETQEVARAYDAACTPDFFLFDNDLKCVYRGRFDSSTPGNGQPVDGSDLRRAMDALLAGNPVLEDQLPSMGCNIKWKA